jgi:hypothetical protein
MAKFVPKTAQPKTARPEAAASEAAFSRRTAVEWRNSAPRASGAIEPGEARTGRETSRAGR